MLESILLYIKQGLNAHLRAFSPIIIIEDHIYRLLFKHSDFAEDICSVKTKPPYVCNGCSQLPKCILLKRIYDPADAHEMAHQSISESRTGILSNEDDIARINGIISPLVKNGQSLHQIYIENVDEIMCSEKTLYNYVDAQLFDIRNIDLPRKVK